MISKPEVNGWCQFGLGNFHGTPSFVTDVPVDLLDAFLQYHHIGFGMAWFDGEGSEFALILTPYSIFIVEKKEYPVLYDLSDHKIAELERGLIKDIEKDLYGWSMFTENTDTEEISFHRNMILQEIAKLKKIIDPEPAKRVSNKPMPVENPASKELKAELREKLAKF